MRPERTILVATDFSSLADVGVDVGLALARRTGAQLHVVHVLDPSAPFFPFQFNTTDLEALETKRCAIANAKLESIRSNQLSVTRELRRGIVSQELVRAAETAKVDLIIIASHGYGPIRRAVLGSVAASLIRTSSIPVLVVGPDRRGVDFDVVLAAVDLSKISREVIERARTFATKEGTVHVVSLIDQPTVVAEDLLPYYPIKADLDRMAVLRVEAVRAILPSDASTQIEVESFVRSPVALGILETSERLPADLIVLGASGHSAWHRAFLGSTATRVLSAAKCPVLVVPNR